MKHMTSGMYHAGIRLVLQEQWSWPRDDHRLALVSRHYKPALAVHQSFNELPYHSVVAMSGLLTKKQVMRDSCLIADPVIFDHVAEDKPAIVGIILFHCPKPQTLIHYECLLAPMQPTGTSIEVDCRERPQGLVRLHDFIKSRLVGLRL